MAAQIDGATSIPKLWAAVCIGGAGSGKSQNLFLHLGSEQRCAAFWWPVVVFVGVGLVVFVLEEFGIAAAAC